LLRVGKVEVKTNNRRRQRNIMKVIIVSF